MEGARVFLAGVWREKSISQGIDFENGRGDKLIHLRKAGARGESRVSDLGVLRLLKLNSSVSPPAQDSCSPVCRDRNVQRFPGFFVSFDASGLRGVLRLAL